MIDDKEIDIAARAVVLNKHINETAYFQLRSIEDFKAGAKWMQEEFLKELWHQTDEQLEGYDEWILLHYNVGNYYSLAQVKDFKSWKGFVKRAPIEKWLYIDDLFPKEGGEK